MKTKIDYWKAYNELRRSAEEELKNFLANIPGQYYDFMTEDEFPNLENNEDSLADLDTPVLTLHDDFNNQTISIFVASISIENNALIISGFEAPLYTQEIEVKDYHTCDVTGLGISELFKYLPD